MQERKHVRTRAREYRLRAKHCLDIAEGLEGARKVVLLDMAQAWLRLADQAKRNQGADLVYETPTPGRQVVASTTPRQVAHPDPSSSSR